MRSSARSALLIVSMMISWVGAAQTIENDYRLYAVMNLQRSNVNKLDSYTTCWEEYGGMPRDDAHYDYRHWIHLRDNEGVAIADSGPRRVGPARVAEDRQVGYGTSGDCYRSRMHCTAWPVLDQTWGSGQRCIDRVVVPPCEGACDPQPECPLVINPGNGPWRLTGSDDTVRFDMDADGKQDTTTWTAEGAALAFLARDMNGNRQIDDGSELFGQHTRLSNGTLAANGFDALAAFDANSDGVISSSDPAWPDLLLWTDLNHNGRSEPEELTPISQSTITALDVAYTWTGRRDPDGNLFRYLGHLLANGKRHPYYDVYFSVTQN